MKYIRKYPKNKELMDKTQNRGNFNNFVEDFKYT